MAKNKKTRGKSKNNVIAVAANSHREVYIARASAKAAKAAKAAAPFTITVVFLGGLTTAQKNAFKSSADRWSKVIVGDLPDVVIGGQVVDDVLIEASGVPIDGPGGILGQAGPTHLRPAGTGGTSLIPAKGRMQFDTADLAAMQSNGTLNDVITHEMGHVLGIGTIWNLKGLLSGTSGTNPVFTGINAKKEFGTLKGTGPKPVPVENTGGPGTRNSHWRDTVFINELMTGFVNTAPNPMSRLTVASLKDLGYKVDLSKAETFNLPDLIGMAEAGLLLGAVEAREAHGMVLPTVPMTLPVEAIA
ncbi:MAG: leishmanolysin-related zinc metalloendopeptidase [Vicinamibacterales bacterium]